MIYILPEHLETIPMFQAKKEFATDDCMDAGGRATQEQLPRTQRGMAHT
jgi:hypothetical protein